MKNTTLLTEDNLVELGFTKRMMAGTGWLTIYSMRDAIYWYEKGRIAINATTFWTWFLDKKQRNDIAVNTKEELAELLENIDNLK